MVHSVAGKGFLSLSALYATFVGGRRFITLALVMAGSKSGAEFPKFAVGKPAHEAGPAKSVNICRANKWCTCLACETASARFRHFVRRNRTVPYRPP